MTRASREEPPVRDAVHAVGRLGADWVARAGPVMTSAVLSLGLIFVLLAFIAVMRSGGGEAAPGDSTAAAVPEGSADGEEIECGGGKSVRSSYELDGDDFSVVGRLASVNTDGALLVKGPTQYLHLKADAETVKEAKVTGGDVVRVEGTIEEGDTAKATKISPMCEAATSSTASVRPSTTLKTGQETFSPVLTLAPTVAGVSAAPTDAAKPSPDGTPKPTREPEPTEDATETPETTDVPSTETPQATATSGVEGTTAP